MNYGQFTVTYLVDASFKTYFSLYYWMKGYGFPHNFEEVTRFRAKQQLNKSAFEALPPDLQAILMAGTEVMNQLLLDELTARNNEALRVLVEDHNVELRKLPDEVLTELHRISDQVVAELAQADPTTRRIHESWAKFKEGIGSYHGIAEDALVNARNLPLD